MLCLRSQFLFEWIHFLAVALRLTEFFLQWNIKNLNFIKARDQLLSQLKDHEFESQPELHSFGFRDSPGLVEM